MQDQPHRIRQRLVDRGLHRGHVGVGQIVDMGPDDPGDQLVGRRGGDLGRLAADQLLEIGQLAVGRHLVAARGLFRRMDLLAMLLAPVLQFLRRRGRGGPGAKAAAERGEAAEDLDLVEKLVGMQIVDPVEPDLDPGALLADRQHQRGLEAGDDVFDGVDIEPHRAALGQRRAGFHLAARRTAREVAHDRHPEPVAAERAAVGPRRPDIAEGQRHLARMHLVRHLRSSFRSPRPERGAGPPPRRRACSSDRSPGPEVPRCSRPAFLPPPTAWC